jgi:hypothetical protein
MRQKAVYGIRTSTGFQVQVALLEKRRKALDQFYGAYLLLSFFIVAVFMEQQKRS